MFDIKYKILKKNTYQNDNDGCKTFFFLIFSSGSKRGRLFFFLCMFLRIVKYGVSLPFMQYFENVY